MALLARDTGGLFGTDFAAVLQNEQGYYAIGFQPEETTVDPSERWSPAKPAQLKVRRPGVVVRSRAGFLKRAPRVDFPVPAEYSELLKNALTSPFASSDIPARLTAVFSDYSPKGPVVDAILHFDPRDISLIHDLQGIYQGSLQMRTAAYTDDGRSTVPLMTASKIAMRPAEYRYGIEHGLRVSFQITLPSDRAPGRSARWWPMVRAIASGSAMQFVEIPNVKLGSLAMSGLVLRGETPAGASVFGRSECGLRCAHFQAGRPVHVFLCRLRCVARNG